VQQRFTGQGRQEVHQPVMRTAGLEGRVGVRMQDEVDRQPSLPVGLQQGRHMGLEVGVAAPLPARQDLEGILDIDDQEGGSGEGRGEDGHLHSMAGTFPSPA
jgi:hypothetical protein